MKCELKSHPDKLLKNHLFGVTNIGLKIFDKNKIYSRYRNFMYMVLLFHDIGKASSYFQNYITQTQKVKEELKSHAEISALWFYFYAINKLQWDKKLSVLGYILIKTHHSDLDNFHDMCLSSLDRDKHFAINEEMQYTEVAYIFNDSFFSTESFKNNYESLTRDGRISIRRLKKELNIEDYFFLNYFFSVLLTADKCDAILDDNIPAIEQSWEESFIYEYKRTLNNNKNKLTQHREKALEIAEKNIDLKTRFFSINLPTGAGKTLTVLNTAIKLKNDVSSIQRIIYCLPFTSVIDQITQVLEEILKYNNINITSDVLLKHHHLTQLSYIKQDEADYKFYSDKNSEFLIEGWESELIVSTFYQLLHTLLSDKNKSLRKFHNLSNSVIILDEVQNIPHKYWELIKEVFKKAAEILNIRFILVTATMPLIFSEQNNEIKELIPNKKEFFHSLDRIRLNAELMSKNIDIEEFKKLILKDIQEDKEGKSILIILNTVKSSLEVFNFLKDYIESERLFYLSSNIIPKHRLQRISQIKNDPNGKIIISTQLVEAGVDIDIDVVYRDMSPLDSIFQAAGRCNRNNLGKGASEVKLFNIVKQNKHYYNYIYDYVLIDSSKNLLSKKKYYYENEFLELSHNYFNSVSNYGIGDESIQLLKKINSLSYRNAFKKDEDNEEVFELIESFPVVSSFIAVDDYAEELYNEFLKIKEDEYTNNFDKRIKLKKVYKRMAPFIINVPEKNAKKMGYDESLGKIWFISKDDLEKYYDMITGFKRDEEIVDYII